MSIFGKIAWIKFIIEVDSRDVEMVMATLFRVAPNEKKQTVIKFFLYRLLTLA